MDQRIYYINLYDYYKDLLTEKQKEYFEDYYFNNLTLKEISENNLVSRNAIHKQIKDAVKNLLHYEEVLNLYEKAIKIKKIIEDIDEIKKTAITNLI